MKHIYFASSETREPEELLKEMNRKSNQDKPDEVEKDDKDEMSESLMGKLQRGLSLPQRKSSRNKRIIRSQSIYRYC